VTTPDPGPRTPDGPAAMPAAGLVIVQMDGVSRDELERLLAEHTMLAAAVSQSTSGVLVTSAEPQGDVYPIIYVNPADDPRKSN